MLLGYVQLLVNNMVNCIYNGYIKGNIKCANMLIVDSSFFTFKSIFWVI